MEYIDKRKQQIQHAIRQERDQEHWNEVHEQLLAIQKKSLEVSAPDDADEKEADAVSAKVMSGESAQIHGTGGTINRKGEGSFETTPEFNSKLESSKGGGQSLDDSTQREMESGMNADFSDVKIHTSSEANAMNESVNAKAFTHGQDIYFGKNDSPENKELLAHELVHTVQQGKGVSRKIQRVPYEGYEGKPQAYFYSTNGDTIAFYEGQDPAKLSSPKNFPSGIKAVILSDVPESYKVAIEFSAEVNQFPDFYNAGTKMVYQGFINKNEVFISGVKEVVIELEYYKGDIKVLAKNIYDTYIALKKVQDTFWKSGEGDAEKKLAGLIPDNLSFAQREELNKIFENQYGFYLQNILFRLHPEFNRSSDSTMIDAIKKVAPPRKKDNGIVKITGPENKTLPVGMKVVYKFELSSRFNETYLKSLPHEQQPHIYDWVVRYPNGETSVRSKHGHDVFMGDKNDLEFDTDAKDSKGIYSVYAIVDNGDNEKQLLGDYFEIVEPREIAVAKFWELGYPPENALDIYKTKFLLEQAKLQNEIYGDPSSQKNKASEISIISGENPMHVYTQGTSQINKVGYTITPKANETNFLWYVMPDRKWILPIYNKGGGNSYFPDSELANVHDHKMEDGTNVYHPLSPFDPSPQKSVSILFPTYLSELTEDDRYVVVCERYDASGRMVGVSTYDQYFRSFSNEKNRALKAELEKTKEQVARIDKFSALIEGPVHPLQATFTSTEYGNTIGINLFYGKDKEDNKKIRLIDVTSGSDKSDYVGDNLIKAIDDFQTGQSYPPGYIFLNVTNIGMRGQLKGETVRKIITDGDSLIEKGVTWTEWLSRLAFVSGIITAVVPGLQEFTPVLFEVGFALGAGSVALDLWSQSTKDKQDWTTIAVDIGILASSFMIAIGSGLKIAANASESILLATRAEQFFYLSGAFGVGTGAVLTADAISQINAFLETTKNDPKERREQQFSYLLLQLLVSGVFIVVSAGQMRSTRTSLLKKGVSSEALKNLEGSPATMLMVDELTELEIKQALQNGEDLGVVAKRKRAKTLAVQEREEVRQAYKRHGLDYKYKEGEVERKSRTATKDDVETIAKLRRQTNAGGDRNVAYAKGKMGDDTIYLYTTSGKYPGNQLNQKGNFTPVNDPYYKGANPGFPEHTEHKIIEYLRERYKNTPDIIGEIELVSERAYCTNCLDVVDQFQLDFPNITITRVEVIPEIK
ncbi:MAG: DUF4157 domain-containing protein [Bacteroidia bacterium]